jgi:DNA-binding NtrC family response regulator
MNFSSRILVADSDENFLLSTVDLLQREGYQCTPARDGSAAFRALEANEYDLLITEIDIPGNEHLELVWSVNRYEPGMPIIICTGHPSLRSAVTSIHLSVTAYLIKPVEFNVLLHLVKSCISDYHNFKLHGSDDEMKEVDRLRSAIQETIGVLQSTRSSFKSKKLANLRRKLERLLATGLPESNEKRKSGQRNKS